MPKFLDPPPGHGSYDGDPGSAGHPRTLSPSPRRAPVALGYTAGPTDGVPNSTTGEPGDVPAERIPAHADTLGHDSDAFHLGPARRHGGDQPGFRLVSHPDAAWAGALFAAVDAQV